MKFKSVVFTIFFFAILTISAESTEPKMYWTDNDAGTIQRANLDGSNIETLVHTRYPRGIAIDLTNKKMYWIDWPQVSISAIKRANLDGTEIETLTTDLYIPQDIALDISRFQMYWVDHGGGIDQLCRANMDGTNVEVIVYGAEARSIALDLENDKLYWTRVQGGGVGSRSIKRANLNGTNVETVVGGLGTPDDIALDLEHNKMYWTDQYTHKVQRANLDGTHIEDLVVTELDRPYGIALDLVNRKMYWTDLGTKKIQRADMDGTNIEDLVTSGLIRPLYITLLPGQPNIPPIADAGADRSVYAGMDGLAQVKLDGTGSYDLDGDELEYFWYDANDLIATGAEPNVILPVGEHVIDLIVNDGFVDSEPNDVLITVIGPVEAQMFFVPQTLNPKSCGRYVMAVLTLPEGVSAGDLDENEPWRLEPGGVEALFVRTICHWRWRRVMVYVVFDRDEVIEAIELPEQKRRGGWGRPGWYWPPSIEADITVYSELKSGQTIGGRDTIRVIQLRLPIPRGMGKGVDKQGEEDL